MTFFSDIGRKDVKSFDSLDWNKLCIDGIGFLRRWAYDCDDSDDIEDESGLEEKESFGADVFERIVIVATDQEVDFWNDFFLAFYWQSRVSLPTCRWATTTRTRRRTAASAGRTVRWRRCRPTRRCRRRPTAPSASASASPRPAPTRRRPRRSARRSPSTSTTRWWPCRRRTRRPPRTRPCPSPRFAFFFKFNSSFQ